jgi:hypothetical protein
MQKDERDLLEALKFDLIEETVGSWLRAIIQRLEEERAAARRAQSKQPPASGGIVRGTPLYQKHHTKRAKPTGPTALDRRRQVVPILGPPGFGQRNTC